PLAQHRAAPPPARRAPQLREHARLPPPPAGGRLRPPRARRAPRGLHGPEDELLPQPGDLRRARARDPAAPPRRARQGLAAALDLERGLRDRRGALLDRHDRAEPRAEGPPPLLHPRDRHRRGGAPPRAPRRLLARRGARDTRALPA